MQIAFLGLGTMGLPMAANLLKAGHSVRAWNRSPGPVDKLVAQGAQGVTTAADAAHGAQVLITMLADDAATRDTIVGGGALDALARGAIHINMGTVSVALARELAALHAARGVAYVAAPVLGRVNVAEAGQLNILAAGDSQALTTVQPLFDILGQKTWIFGDKPEQANAVKLGVNFMIGAAIGAMSEGAALAQGYDVDPAAFLDLVTATVFAAPVYKIYGGAIAEQRFEPAGFKLALGGKDVRLALEAGEQANVPMTLASTLRDAHIEAIAHGHKDWAALALTARRRAGRG
ncbi:3-hydroxyisobutyrate dehydrogenase family protein [Cupriavidus sp. U2]|uniref:NAD(P)-dependent oxidoreductase n=1 Tax=Cupriavidus sp. U2 TaxID=2920269 RepID=UPI00129E1065|nr:NAD(P)-dependent oxidoreductase [Cupriavidus sp. U2]KAI3590011.1 3-hydroxyisobutyrate dehydrogenase family protein [Cupriavidus sp. U2]